MLREIVGVVQNDSQVEKRWFESEYFDLYVWQRENAIVHMQLCYRRGREDESAVSWKEGLGLFHDGVDTRRRTESPLLESGGSFDAERVNARFLRESSGLPVELRKFVLAKLHEFALQGPVKRNAPRRVAVRREDWQKHDDHDA